MSTANYEEVLQAARALTPAERQRLRAEMDSPLTPASNPMSEEEFALELLREGILDQVSSRAKDPIPYPDWVPIEIVGKPLSESLIEDRR